MKIRHLLIASALIVAPLAANADHWRGDRHGHRHSREYKQEYWDGHCKVKREYKRNGSYKEKRSCKPPRYRHYYDDGPVVYRSGGPVIVIDPVIRIGGRW